MQMGDARLGEFENADIVGGHTEPAFEVQPELVEAFPQVRDGILLVFELGGVQGQREEILEAEIFRDPTDSSARRPSPARTAVRAVPRLAIDAPENLPARFRVNALHRPASAERSPAFRPLIVHGNRARVSIIL